MQRFPLIILICALFLGACHSIAWADTPDKDSDHKSVTISEIPKFPPPASIIPQWRRDRIQISYYTASTNKPESLEYRLFTSGQSLSNLEANVYRKEPLLPFLEAYREEPRRWFEKVHSNDLNTIPAGAGGAAEKQSRDRAAGELRRIFTAINLYQLSQDSEFRKLAQQAYDAISATPNRIDWGTYADSELKKTLRREFLWFRPFQ
ncbi:MAG: hypothetical protein JWM04_594 [Verrucomicrobiales bacterium]|nr:hypothetical protein [Verrucomicrobiales bacterium]